ncbi:MAG: hypothetical protein ABW128_06920 [Rhizorhabdus sp.]
MIPDEDAQGLAPRDHNQPPDPVEVMRVAMPEALERFQKRRDEIVASANRKTVTDRFTAADAGDIISIADKVQKRIDAVRRELTDPHHQARDLGKAIADEFWTPAEEALTQLRERLQAWNDVEDKRIADQQREQDEFMARMQQGGSQPAVVNAPDPKPEGVREHIDYSAPAGPAPTSVPGMRPAKKRKIVGDLGGVVTTADVTEYTITDIRLVPDFIMSSPTVHAAVKQVIKSMARHLGEIPGVEKTTSSAVRVK